MLNSFNNSRSDNSLGAIINRIISGSFAVAVVGMAGVMTFAQYFAVV